MAKVATPSVMPPSSHGISSVPLKGASIAKRKTPSELRVSFRAPNPSLFILVFITDI